MQPTQLPQTDIFLHEDRQLDLGTGRPETGVPGWVSGLGVQVVVPGAFGNGNGFLKSRTHFRVWEWDRVWERRGTRPPSQWEQVVTFFQNLNAFDRHNSLKFRTPQQPAYLR